MAFFEGRFDEAAELWADQQEDDRSRGNRVYDWAASRWLGVLSRTEGDTAAAEDPAPGGARMRAPRRKCPPRACRSGRAGAGPGRRRPSRETPRPHLIRAEEILAGGEDWRGVAGRVELARAAALVAEEEREAGGGRLRGGHRDLPAPRPACGTRRRRCSAGARPASRPGTGPGRRRSWASPWRSTGGSVPGRAGSSGWWPTSWPSRASAGRR